MSFGILRKIALTGMLALGVADVSLGASGYLSIKTASGSRAALPYRLTFENGWNGKIHLTTRGADLVAVAHARAEIDGKTYVALTFPELPGSQDGTMLVLKGAYDSKTRYAGQVLAGTYAAQSVEEHQAALAQIVNDPANGGLTVKGNFEFTPREFPGSVESVYEYRTPPTGFIRGVPVYKGFAPSGDANEPCPLGPCWTDAGVGRRLEYYSGKIQNPGGPSRAAGFMRGVPYSWTRQGQIEAQLAGIERTRTLYAHIDRYAAPRWGFFWFFW